MANLKKSLSLRIPDHAALAVALVLVVTAAGSNLNESLDNGVNSIEGNTTSTVMPLKAEKLELDPSSDDARGGAKPVTARFLLFRHG